MSNAQRHSLLAVGSVMVVGLVGLMTLAFGSSGSDDNSVSSAVDRSTGEWVGESPAGPGDDDSDAGPARFSAGESTTRPATSATTESSTTVTSATTATTAEPTTASSETTATTPTTEPTTASSDTTETTPSTDTTATTPTTEPTTGSSETTETTFGTITITSFITIDPGVTITRPISTFTLSTFRG